MRKEPPLLFKGRPIIFEVQDYFHSILKSYINCVEEDNNERVTDNGLLFKCELLSILGQKLLLLPEKVDKVYPHEDDEGLICDHAEHYRGESQVKLHCEVYLVEIFFEVI